ncbi:MAG: precorrin-4 C(11)-methyltransferase [bacterium]|nr:MAG: precorrin-4 C(11)-methyltransferase [bacterium]
MKVLFMGAGPGAGDLLTVRGKKLLEECRFCIYAGSLISCEILDILPVNAQRHDSAKLNLGEITDLYRKARDENVDVVRLHSGDTSIYSSIREQIMELDKLDIKYEVVPGVSSFQAAAAALNVELTIPGDVQTVILTRMAGRTPVPNVQSLDKLAETGSTLCIFLSVDKIGEAAKTLSRRYGDGCPIAVVYRASWPDQKILSGTLKDITEMVKKSGIKKTAMIIVGKALDKRHAASKLYDKNFSHGYRKAT